MPLLRRADGADRPVSTIVAGKPLGLARQLMNAARSLPPDQRLACGRPFRLGRPGMRAFCRACRRRAQFAARVGGVQHAIGAFCRWQRAAKPTRRLVGITIGHIGVDRRAKIPIAELLPAV